ncbi:MAG: DNA (cytosine-5-)-methyltransferase [Pseudomonadota bacterium]
MAKSIFVQLCESAAISTANASSTLKLSVDIAAEYESGARVPSPREIQILKGLALGRIPNEVRTATDGTPLIRPQKSGAMPKPKKNNRKSSNKLTSLELCAGGGGAALGLEAAGFHPRALVELDPHACATLRSNRNYWNVIEGDIRKLDLSNWKGVDLLSGGLPCPPFSIAGKQLGPDDERDLFPAMLKIVKDVKPRAVLIENVRGIITDRFKFYREKIDAALSKQGFDTYWAAFNAVNFGVPQTRFRAFLVALRRNETNPLEWPFDFDKNPVMPVTVADAIGNMMEERGWRGAEEWKMRASAPAPTVVGGSHKHGGPDLGPTRARKEWAELGVDGLGLANEAPEQNFVGMPRLTVPMVAQLQSFPKNWNFVGGKTQSYRQVGNALPVLMAEGVAKVVRQCLG